ncbi:hybrid sensor histidine kinase/response regulator [Aggregatilinea lenta]|uniref:hybrid sensor histidine kinase/response regulator n=1 Tax=Aggregatilinea lenta TaxID=913108 RepID=UPI000E5AA289|nr:hybrid sensor histidine kinase/response regulator [Aggregatilinea lenta]
MSNSDDLLRELLQTFQVEASEHLQTLNMSLLALEVRPEEAQRRELVQEAFRAAHSLKGAARAVGLDDVEQLSHAMENVLQGVRDTDETLEASAYDVLYEVLDSIGKLLEGESVEVMALVNRLSQNGNGTGTQSGNGTKPQAVPTADVESAPTVQAPSAPAVEPEPVVPAPVTNAVPSPAPVPAPAVEPEFAAPAPVVNTVPNPAPVPAPVEELHGKPRAASSEETIRVAIPKLDNLMAQVGELLVSRMNAEQRASEMQAVRYQFASWSKVWREVKTLLPQLDGDASKRLSEVLARYHEQVQATTEDVSLFDQRLRQDTLRLGVIASQLQDNVRRVRMVPFETVVPSLQRAVRDAVHTEGKQASFQVFGGEVELDKKVLEMLKDPLLHLLRNAVSHGIECPEDRRERGKPEEGTITLSLQQRGAEVRISVRDDGGGFDLGALRQASTSQGDHMLDERASQEEIIGLAFLSGVTTTHEVTALSGRGIGLDVVRQRLETMQGRIEVDSVPGHGAAIHLLLPVTLTISRGLLVRVGDQRYVLPLLSVVKIIKPRQIFTVEGRTMITIDDATLPLVSLGSLLNHPEAESNEQALAVIVAVAEQRFALLVDDVITEQELAVKPLGKPLHRVRNVAGAALLGDGKPVVILNTADLIRSAKGVRQPAAFRPTEALQEKTKAHILVVDDSITTRTLEKNILETAGFDVTTATDGSEALHRLDAQPIDLVVSDVEMPNMNGIELTRQIRETGEFRDLPVILVTSLESREDRERGMMAGADAYIVKRGFDQAELLKTIQQLIMV